MLSSSFLRTACLFLAFLGFVLTASPAAAQHRHHPRDLDVSFDAVDVAIVNGAVKVSYEIDHRDWRRLSKLHIRPRLNLYTPTRHNGYQFAYSAELQGRSGQVWFSNVDVRRFTRRVEIRLSGQRGRTRIATTSYRHERGSRVRVAVVQPQRQHHKRRHRQYTRAEMIDACSANTSWSGDLKRCIQKADGLADAPATINACGAETSWSGDFMDCLDLARGLRRNADNTILACGAASSWSGDFKDCLRHSQHLGPQAPAIVDSCSAATSWSGDFKDCLVAARRS